MEAKTIEYNVYLMLSHPKTPYEAHWQYEDRTMSSYSGTDPEIQNYVLLTFKEEDMGNEDDGM